MANTSINLIDLDQDGLKQSLITFLRGNEQFKDYDFDGSNLNVLLDILSYNSFQNMFFLNMAISESFLDSAQMRNSVLSHAKELNYIPRSARSAKARVRVDFRATGASQPYIVQKGQSFSTMVKNDSYVFSMPETMIVASSNNVFSFETDIYDGIYLQDTYIYLSTSDIQRFRITNKNVDTNSISVTVYEDNSIFGKTYTYSDTLLDINETSRVYFLQASENGYYEILFGDGVLGARPKINSTIVLDYRLSNDIKPNGARNFVINFDPTGVSGELTNNPTVTTLSYAQDGDVAESNDSVKYYAPRHFQVQDRATVPTDYEILLRKEFPEINTVSAFGGEEISPPQYAKVFISVDIKNVTGLPDSKKQQYTEFLRRKSSMIPVFLVPEFLYLSIRSKVNYNVNISANSTERIRTLVTNAITEFNAANLNDFKVNFRYSQFTTAIDDTDPSIISNDTYVRVYKKIVPNVGQSQNINLSFEVPVTNMISSVFTYAGQNCLFKDDGAGGVKIVRREVGGLGADVLSIGTIDYDTGTISIHNFNPQAYSGEAIRIYGEPLELDIVTPRNNIMTIEADEIAITVDGLRE